jgi:hypothetical protein
LFRRHPFVPASLVFYLHDRFPWRLAPKCLLLCEFGSALLAVCRALSAP